MSFNNLNFTNVEAESTPKLKTGIHDVVVSEAVFKPNKSGTGNLVQVKLEGLNISGYQSISFNVEHQNPEAMKIGQQQFKAFMIAAGHPNPNNPGDVRSVNNLRLKLVVEENGTYQGNDGKQYPSYEPAKRGAFQPLDQAVQGNMQNNAQAQNDFVQSAQPQQQQPQYGQQTYDGFPS